MIREYGILNDRIETDDAFLYGIPYPGVYVTDEAGRVVAKFFHDTYKKRDSPEHLLDAALGRLELSEDTPRAAGGAAERSGQKVPWAGLKTRWVPCPLFLSRPPAVIKLYYVCSCDTPGCWHGKTGLILLLYKPHKKEECQQTKYNC